jgi:fatty acid desaturase
MNPSTEGDYLSKAVDIAIRLAVIGVIVLASYRIFSPFLLVVVWAIVLAITLHPVYEKVKEWPLIGEKAYALWQSATVDLEGTAKRLEPQLRKVGEKIISGVSDLA